MISWCGASGSQTGKLGPLLLQLGDKLLLSGEQKKPRPHQSLPRKPSLSLWFWLPVYKALKGPGCSVYIWQEHCRSVWSAATRLLHLHTAPGQTAFSVCEISGRTDTHISALKIFPLSRKAEELTTSHTAHTICLFLLFTEAVRSHWFDI